MRYSYEFVDGDAAKHILHALYDCAAQEIAQLRADNALNSYKDEVYLSYKSLKYSALDDYAEVSGHSMRELIFGTDKKPKTHYTAIDKAVISALDSLAAEELAALHHIVKAAHSTDMMNMVGGGPSYRLISYYKTRKFTPPTVIDPEEKYKYNKDVVIEFERFKKSNYSSLFRFSSDYLPDLATALGVSLHWVLGIQRNPLFCNTTIGDELFSWFTMMEPPVRKTFVGYLLRFSTRKSGSLEEFYYSGREGV